MCSYEISRTEGTEESHSTKTTTGTISSAEGHRQVTTRTCTICGFVRTLTGVVIEHTYDSSGKCTECGWIKTSSFIATNSLCKLDDCCESISVSEVSDFDDNEKEDIIFVDDKRKQKSVIKNTENET